MSNWQYAAKLPTSPWRGQMSLPWRLSFLNDQAGLAIKQEPVTAPLRIKHEAILPTQGGKLGSSFQEAPFELDLRFNQSSELVFGVRLYTDEKHWTEVGFERSFTSIARSRGQL